MYQSIQRTTNAVTNPARTVPAQSSMPSVNSLTMCVSQPFPPSSDGLDGLVRLAGDDYLTLQ